MKSMIKYTTRAGVKHDGSIWSAAPGAGCYWVVDSAVVGRFVKVRLRNGVYTEVVER